MEVLLICVFRGLFWGACLDCEWNCLKRYRFLLISDQGKLIQLSYLRTPELGQINLIQHLLYTFQHGVKQVGAYSDFSNSTDLIYRHHQIKLRILLHMDDKCVFTAFRVATWVFKCILGLQKIIKILNRHLRKQERENSERDQTEN